MVERQSSAYDSCLMLRVRGAAAAVAAVVVYAAHTHTYIYPEAQVALTNPQRCYRSVIACCPQQLSAPHGVQRIRCERRRKNSLSSSMSRAKMRKTLKHCFLICCVQKSAVRTGAASSWKVGCSFTSRVIDFTLKSSTAGGEQAPLPPGKWGQNPQAPKFILLEDKGAAP